MQHAHSDTHVSVNAVHAEGYSLNEHGACNVGEAITFELAIFALQYMNFVSP